MTTPQRSMTTAGPEQYAILIMGDADRWWTTMSQEERSAGYATYGRFAQSLAARGHRVLGGAELHRTSEARTVRAGGSVSDGPFAETAEHVGGFFHVETRDYDDLLDCCGILAELGDGIEVRRVVREDERVR